MLCTKFDHVFQADVEASFSPSCSDATCCRVVQRRFFVVEYYCSYCVVWSVLYKLQEKGTPHLES